MRILITGGNGLLAHALQWHPPADVELVVLGHAKFDLTQPPLMAQRLTELRPDAVINTAAYNAVDRCETERDLSWAVNAAGPHTLAQLCSRQHCRLVHFGTDYVFDGAQGSPYTEDDQANPLNHYAAGKWAGEQAVLQVQANHLVLRTSWLFGHNPARPKSYVHTVLRQALAGHPLKATADQVSVPTYAPDLARWTFAFLRLGTSGLIHAVNDEGLSRYDWTLAILDEARPAGLWSVTPSVERVSTDYFSPGLRRPSFSVLDNRKAAAILGHPLGSWRPGLREMLRQIRESSTDAPPG
ncbi:MAG: dTDP-4-dehydrorhamnose reductase [Chloroflexi bacterium]|nr:dTDP-4-dehydrorhamnose reductase [Chloroflexota bacterium]